MKLQDPSNPYNRDDEVYFVDQQYDTQEVLEQPENVKLDNPYDSDGTTIVTGRKYSIEENLGPIKDVKIDTPFTTQKNLSCDSYSGFLGQCAQTHILLSDISDLPHISILAINDVYLAAADTLQSQNTDYKISVSELYKQYLESAEEHVTGIKEICVGKNNTLVVHQHHNETIGANQLLNVGGFQHTIVGGGQQLDIADDYILDIQKGNLVEIVNGQKSETTKKKSTHRMNSSAEKIILGGLFKFKASTESTNVEADKIAASLSNKKTIAAGGSEKVELSSRCEFNFSMAKKFVCGAKISVNLGMAQNISPVSKIETTILKQTMKLLEEKALLIEMNSKADLKDTTTEISK